MMATSIALIPVRSHTGLDACLYVALVPGPPGTFSLRPSQFEADAFRHRIQREAQYGKYPLFRDDEAIAASLQHGTLVLRQGTASLRLDETGAVLIGLPAMPDREQPGSPSRSELPAIIEEEIEDGIARALRFGSRLFSHIDSKRQLTHVAVTAALIRDLAHGFRGSTSSTCVQHLRPAPASSTCASKSRMC
jgi:hypothetical protein